MFENIFNETAKFDNPSVLVPLADTSTVNKLIKYFEPRSIVCMNTNRSALLKIPYDCYKMPANFLNENGRVSLNLNAFDLAVVPNIADYWYVSYNYVMKGGYIVGEPAMSDRRFSNWSKAVRMKNGIVTVY